MITETLTYEWYDTQSYYDSNSHPTSESEFDNFFDSSNSGVSSGGSGTYSDIINWGNGGQSTEIGSVGSKPSYLPADGYSWKVTGYIVPPETGTYTIGVDADDATDVFIGGQNVVSWYDGHGFDGNYGHNGTIDLSADEYYTFKARMEEGGGGDGISVAWQKPSTSSWEYIPHSVFSTEKLPTPTIDGTDITEITIDNTFVTEVTIDGAVVWSDSSIVAKEDLVFRYDFSNGDATDQTSNGYNGTVSGASYIDNGGPQNTGAFEFSSDSDYIDVPDSAAISGTSPRTLVIVFSANSLGSRQTPAGYGGGNEGDTFEFNTGDIYSPNSGSPDDAIGIHTWGGQTFAENVLSTNTYHFAAARSNTSGFSSIKIYLDGNEQSVTHDHQGTMDTSATGFSIGSSLPHGSSTDNPFYGKIAEVRFYSAELSTTQLDTMYSNIMNG